MTALRSSISITVALLLAGCASTSTIEKADTGKSEFEGAIYGGKTGIINEELPGVAKHRIFHKGATGFVSIETIRASALGRADAHCARGGASTYLIQETTSTPPHILGNWPRIEIVFSCLAKAKETANASSPDKYERLAKLKTLLDTAVLTQQEYDNEKKKVLSE